MRAGKIVEIGCSNFSAEQIREATAATSRGAAAFASVQNEYSLLNRDPEHEVLPQCERLGIGFLPYFPLASGLLTGQYRKGVPTPEGVRLRPGSARLTSVIAGATSREQVRANTTTANWDLTSSDLAEIDRIAPLRHALSTTGRPNAPSPACG